MKKYRLFRFDVETSFLQICEAGRDIFVIPPNECQDRIKCIWVLMTAGNGLVDSNAKWKIMSDPMPVIVGFSVMPKFPQMFLYFDAHEIMLIMY